MSGRYQRGSLRREGDRWILRRRVDGKEQRLPIGKVADLRTEGAARRAADALLETMAEGARAAGERITFERYATFFLDKVCAQKKPATVVTYRSVIKQHLLPRLGREPLTRIDGRAFTRLISDLEGEQLSPRTVRLSVIVLARALRSARSNGYAAADPDTKILRLDSKRSLDRPRRVFTREELVRIVHGAPYPWRALYALLAYAGLRTGEALGLSWPAIDLAGASITIFQAAYMGQIQTTKTAESAVTIPIISHLVEELGTFRYWWQDNCRQAAPLFENAPGAGLLFPSPQDPARACHRSGVHKHHFVPLLKRLGIEPEGFHIFRRTYVTELFRAGAAAPTVKRLARHSDLKTTERYAQLNVSDQRAAVEAFGRALPAT
ncbi:MAG TPA: tyrosine-type recombinase/integrase [Steroidobacteraceae bacterium]|jgi:integrase